MSYAPQGFTTITSSLVFKDAAKAIELYKKAFGATEDSRMTNPDNNKIMHAVLTIGNSKVFVSDEFPSCPAGGTPRFYLYVPDVDASIKQAVAAGFTQTMPAEDMFWGDRLGALRDEFGVEWSVATKTREVSAAEMEKGGQEFIAKMRKASSQAA